MGDKIREFVCIDFWRSDVGKVTRFALASVFTLIVLPLTLTAIIQATNIWKSNEILQLSQERISRALEKHIEAPLGHNGVEIVVSDIKHGDELNTAAITAIQHLFKEHNENENKRLDKLTDKLDVIEDFVSEARTWQAQHELLRHNVNRPKP